MKRFLTTLLLLLALGFGAVMFLNNESPRAAWKRIVDYLQGQLSPKTPPTAPTPIRTPEPTPEPTATPTPEPPPSPGPTPPPDPLAWLLEHQDRWPKEVVLTRATVFPAVLNGKTVGSVQAPAGSRVSLHGMEVDHLTVIYHGGGARVAIEATNLIALAKSEMEKPEAGPAGNSVAPVPVTPKAVPRENADYVDAFFPADPTSQKKHQLGSYDLTKMEVYTGQAELKAVRLLPDEKNPHAGDYPGTYGGEITFVMKVDGDAQNYLTGKFSGEETSDNRFILEVNGREVGGRHTADEEFFEGMHGPVCPGAFYYRTAPIPRTLTDGEREVKIRLRSTGRYYYYGKPHDYASYQRVMEAPTRGIYGLFMHTDAGILPDPGPILGQTPSYADSGPRDSDSLQDIRDQQIEEFDKKTEDLIRGKGIPGHNAAWNPLELIARCYYRPEVKSAYKNREVVQKICDVVDQLVREDNEGKSKAGGEWGGNYGRWGSALAIIAGEIEPGFLDAKVDLGQGEQPRRGQWIRIFKESCEFGATNRRTISNQEMFASLSVFGAALALEKISPGHYIKHLETGYHHILESCGIEEFTGNAVIGVDGPKPGDPKDAFTGPGYYFTTLKGTTHEPGWVSADCYGNLGNTLVEMFAMTRLYPGGEGDKRVLATAVKHTTIQAGFTYAWNVEGHRAILTEGYCCVRNHYVPGKIFYGAPEVAGASMDPTLMGYMRQCFEDGHLKTSSPNCSASVFTIDLLDALIKNRQKYTARIPSSPDQPDYFLADEENAILLIKRGREQVFMNMFYRTDVDNKLVQVHHISEAWERFIELRPQHTEYRTNGEFKTRGEKVTSWSGEAPDNPLSAYAGQEDKISLGMRGILDLYQVKYGKYFVAMNTTRPGIDKIVTFPKELVGREAFAMHLGKTIRIPDKAPIVPLTTQVFILEK